MTEKKVTEKKDPVAVDRRADDRLAELARQEAVREAMRKAHGAEGSAA